MLVAVFSLSAVMAFGGEISKDTETRVRLLNERSVKLSGGKVAEYAKDALGVAQINVLAAQAAVANGNEKQALQKAELAELQLAIAEAKAAEKEAAEQTALRRVELKKLEAQFDNYFQGGEK